MKAQCIFRPYCIGYLIDTYNGYDLAFYLAGIVIILAGLANLVPWREIASARPKLYQSKSAEESMIKIREENNQGKIPTEQIT